MERFSCKEIINFTEIPRELQEKMEYHPDDRISYCRQEIKSKNGEVILPFIVDQHTNEKVELKNKYLLNLDIDSHIEVHTAGAYKCVKRKQNVKSYAVYELDDECLIIEIN